MVLEDGGVGRVARHQTRSRWVKAGGAVLAAVVVLVLALVSGRALERFPPLLSREGIAAAVLVAWAGTVLHTLATTRSTRHQLQRTIAKHAPAWSAVIRARPADLRRLGTVGGGTFRPVVGGRVDYEHLDVPCVVVLAAGMAMAEIPRIRGGPRLEFRFDLLDEARISINKRGQAGYLALVGNGENFAYRILRPKPDGLPENAVRE